MSSVTPASRLTAPECGPATLTTTGASISVPSASVTPAARPPARRIATTLLLKRNRAPWRSAACCRLRAASCGSVT